jgi:hypothetical protein
MWAQACETATYVLNRTGKKVLSGKFPTEMWNGQVMKNLDLCVLGTECYVFIPKQSGKKFKENVFGRMIGYLNDKDGYQVYVPSLKKTVHSCDVYFKSERVCTSSVVETGLEKTVVENVDAENRQKMTQCRSRHSWSKY